MMQTTYSSLIDPANVKVLKRQHDGQTGYIVDAGVHGIIGSVAKDEHGWWTARDRHDSIVLGAGSTVRKNSVWNLVVEHNLDNNEADDKWTPTQPGVHWPIVAATVAPVVGARVVVERHWFVVTAVEETGSGEYRATVNGIDPTQPADLGRERAYTVVLPEDAAEPQPETDERGVVLLDPADPRASVCGHCGRAWDDSVSTSVTPTPSGRCPFEHEHEYDDENDCDGCEEQPGVIVMPGSLFRLCAECYVEGLPVEEEQALRDFFDGERARQSEPADRDDLYDSYAERFFDTDPADEPADEPADRDDLCGECGEWIEPGTGCRSFVDDTLFCERCYDRLTAQPDVLGAVTSVGHGEDGTLYLSVETDRTTVVTIDPVFVPMLAAMVEPQQPQTSSYSVSVGCTFDNVGSPEDAVRMMVAWLADSAPVAGYRVQAEDGTSVFLDAEGIDLDA